MTTQTNQWIWIGNKVHTLPNGDKFRTAQEADTGLYWMITLSGNPIRTVVESWGAMEQRQEQVVDAAIQTEEAYMGPLKRNLLNKAKAQMRSGCFDDDEEECY